MYCNFICTVRNLILASTIQKKLETAHKIQNVKLDYNETAN